MDIIAWDETALAAIGSSLIGKSDILDGVLAVFAAYLVYAIPLILILLWFGLPKARHPLFLSTVSALFAWLVVNKLVATFIWPRPRPDLALLEARELFFYRGDYSFPSDHAAMLFGLFFGLCFLGWNKAAWRLLPFAVLIAVARVAVGLHYPLDIVAGVASGFVAGASVKILEKPATRYLLNPFIWVLKKIRLA